VRTTLATALAFLCGTASAQSPEVGTLLDGLFMPRSGRTMRSSSSNPDLNSNIDFLHLDPGQEAVIADLTGPGIIQHLWFTIDCPDPYYPRHLVLRAWWDGEAQPSIEVPLGDFFAVGHGLDATVNSLPVQVSGSGRARNCYWPMPFREGARLTVTNDSDAPVYALYYYVDWVQLPTPLPEDTRRFHAQYRQRYPSIPTEDHVFADLRGAGHYVGSVLSIYSVEQGWPGEGDDRFYIDGEDTFSLAGTGTEDYFCDAWGFRLFTHPCYGVTVWEGDGPHCRTTAYRWHLQDPIVFTTSLHATIENRGWAIRNGQWDGHTHRPDRFASVAYWYQTEPHAEFPAFPAAADRMPFAETRIEVEQVLEALRVPEGAPRPELQPGRFWAGGGQMFFRPEQVEQAQVEVPVSVTEAGSYLVVARWTTSYDYGIYQVAVDGQNLGDPHDLYTPGTDITEERLRVVELAAGDHTLSFRCVGRNANSTGHYLGLDSLMLRR